MRGIRRKRDGYAVGLEPQEREILRAVCLELADELRGGADDEAVRRLFPRAYRDDDAAADEFERLSRPGLEEGKLAALLALADGAGATRLDEDSAQTWIRALNDLRLVIGTRLGVSEDDTAARLEDPGYALYAWLTWLQGELLEALARP